MDDDNLFDDDDALDYIMYEECEKGRGAHKGGNGCFGVALALLIPFVGTLLYPLI